MIIDEIRRLDPAAAVSVTTAATQVVRRNTDRFEAVIQNTHASTAIKVGSEAELAAGHGITIPAGGIYRHCSSLALFAKAASGTVSVRGIEMYGPGNHQDTMKEFHGIAVTATAAIAVSKHGTRLQCVIQNTDSTNTVYIGNNTVTSSTGIALAPGASIVIYGKPEIWAVCAATQTATINVVEYTRI